MTTATEKKTRRSKEEILALVDKAEKLISNGMPKTKAAGEVGLAYQVLTKHLGEGIKNVKGGDNVEILWNKLVNAIEQRATRKVIAKLNA